jgi:hypothetical protein
VTPFIAVVLPFKKKKKEMFKKPVKKPGVVANACNPSTWEAEM